MVREQLRARGVHDEHVLAAMAAVPREDFVPGEARSTAYADRPLGIGSGQTISQPVVVARMAELAGVAPGTRVLEVGAGSGYAAAVMAQAGARVFAVEQDRRLADRAREACAAWPGVTVVHGDGRLGMPDRAPFDAISVAAAADEVPRALLDQLADGGRLVMPVGTRHLQHLTVITRDGDQLRTQTHGGVRFVPLLEGTSD